MYTAHQLQAADYLLKKLGGMPNFPFANENLKLVIEFNSILWYGDFIPFENRTIKQFFIDTDGSIDYQYFYSEGNNATPILEKANSAYLESLPKGNWVMNPYKHIDNLELLFHAVMNIIDNIDIQPDDSPIYPYLLNAKSLDGKLELSFLNIADEKIKVVSLIQVPKEN
ncbi:hypothetical protein [Solibacillus sp. FSL K6-1523]|uniref:hypothetical protein n=1 Tax=Solibacillus sp. FSL K6-1523 TaxID=2921471 RepID=UPI0030FB3D18